MRSSSTIVSPTPRLILTSSSGTAPSGRRSRPSARPSCPMRAASTASIPSQLRSRRPASCASNSAERTRSRTVHAESRRKHTLCFQRERRHGLGVGRERREDVTEIQVGVEPEGMGVSPDGKTLVNTSETTSMAHFIDTATHEVIANVLVKSRPRVARFAADGKQVWVSSKWATRSR